VLEELELLSELESLLVLKLKVLEELSELLELESELLSLDVLWLTVELELLKLLEELGGKGGEL